MNERLLLAIAEVAKTNPDAAKELMQLLEKQQLPELLKMLKQLGKKTVGKIATGLEKGSNYLNKIAGK